MICEVFPMATFQVPSMEVLLTEHFAHYPYTKTFEEAKSDPLLVLHTSGTTSLPKPLTFTNEFTGAYAHALELPVEPGMETKEMYFSGNRMFTTMPPFHAAYLFTTFWMGLLKETTVILPPSQVTPSLDVFIEGIQRIEVSTAFIQPSFISQLASNQEYLNIAAQNVETILASAGNIFDSAVDAVSSRVRLITVFGATEVGGLPDVIPLSTKLAPRDAGAYIHPHPGTGMEFRLYARTEAEQIYEAWIVKNADPGAVQPIFTLFPDATERSTRDLFTPHPIKPNHWRWHSRVDDTVALSTGANVSPASMETGLSQHPAVQGVLMLGNSRVRPLLLVELKDHASYEQEDVKSDIWSTIERLNDNYHQDHKIVKSHLIIAKENKSMLRSLKGSIQRRFTEDLYNPEIDRIYSDVSDGVLNGTNGY
jgi:acyl-coenzyme A synthetase/AMP-(fatty) acid ligase